VATAGSPASATPCTSRRASSASQPGAAAQASPITAEAISEVWMSRVRPSTSETGPVTSKATPSPAVASDNDSVLPAAETENARASSGSRAWVLYSRANVATPAANNATEIRR
jgi:hypothetical protein